MSPVTTCSITITNHSNSLKRFLLFQDAPNPTNGPSGNVFYNVYQRSPKIQGKGSKTSFQMDNQFYAIYGTASSSDIGTTRVYTSDSKIVKLGPNGSVVALTADNGDPMWDDVAAAGKTTMAKGGFSILTDHTFKVPNENNIYIGVGAHDPKETDSVIPIQTYVAEPGLNSQLFPKMCYYICTGEYQPGMIVDRNTIGKALKVDFTGASIPKAVFTVNDFGVYTDEDGVNTKNGINWEMESVPDA